MCQGCRVPARKYRTCCLNPRSRGTTVFGVRTPNEKTNRLIIEYLIAHPNRPLPDVVKELRVNQLQAASDWAALYKEAQPLLRKMERVARDEFLMYFNRLAKDEIASRTSLLGRMG